MYPIDDFNAFAKNAKLENPLGTLTRYLSLLAGVSPETIAALPKEKALELLVAAREFGDALALYANSADSLSQLSLLLHGVNLYGVREKLGLKPEVFACLPLLPDIGPIHPDPANN